MTRVIILCIVNLFIDLFYDRILKRIRILIKRVWKG